MSVMDVFKSRNTLSFEVFPPKTDMGMANLSRVLEQLYDLNPDYISCTYGAGGTNVGRNLEVMDKIVRDGKTIGITHFTCIGSSKADIKAKLQNYLDHGINHILALRGDIPLGQSSTGGDLDYASELVAFARQEFGDKFTIAVAGSPEGHIDCPSVEADIEYLKMKQDNGADFILTQLCWDMDQFDRWMEAIRAAGITMPVDVGIMPILDQKATISMALSRNGCVMPRKLSQLISKHWLFPDPFTAAAQKDVLSDPLTEQKKADFKKEGIEYTIDQIRLYQQYDINGFHLYSLNKFDDVAYIAKEAGLLGK